MKVIYGIEYDHHLNMGVKKIINSIESCNPMVLTLDNKFSGEKTNTKTNYMLNSKTKN